MNKHSSTAVARAGRPLLGDKKRVRTTFTVHPERLRWLQRIAQKQGVSSSELLDELIGLGQAQWAGRGERTSLRVALPYNEISQLCQRHGIRKLSVFGSALREDFGPESDVDMLVEFDEGAAPGLFLLSELALLFSKMLGGRMVDLRTYSELSPPFREQVAKEAVAVYVAPK